ncbi:hypothetical protein CEXT_286481 [Caerostris extrusa]|uniref:Uncharacterized protein n=1 Tax=Caerostris extrusa TaxID=172846 RepID=A0AAV4VMG5_CAEEX|nr:hypothetical protein CEXT_286481 [Caerostris extrusa]
MAVYSKKETRAELFIVSNFRLLMQRAFSENDFDFWLNSISCSLCYSQSIPSPKSCDYELRFTFHLQQYYTAAGRNSEEKKTPLLVRCKAASIQIRIRLIEALPKVEKNGNTCSLVTRKGCEHKAGCVPFLSIDFYNGGVVILEGLAVIVFERCPCIGI